MASLWALPPGQPSANKRVHACPLCEALTWLQGRHAAPKVPTLVHLLGALMQDGTELKARLVVAADGGGSRIRELAGFRTFGWAYNQRALVATVQLEGE